MQKSDIDIHKLSYRVDTIESQVREFHKLVSEFQQDAARKDESIKGLREQAKAHNEAHTKAFAEMKTQMSADRASMESIIERSVRELQGGYRRGYSRRFPSAE